jgi:hypothetical protein
MRKVRTYKGYKKEHFCPKMDYNESLAHFRMYTLKERRDHERHCVELIRKISSEGHRLHFLLPAKVGELRPKDTRSNDDKYYNFKYRTERFRKSLLVYAINSYNNSF